MRRRPGHSSRPPPVRPRRRPRRPFLTPSAAPRARFPFDYLRCLHWYGTVLPGAARMGHVGEREKSYKPTPRQSSL
ncbi:hypothetical protein SSBG_06170 [Streptomyces sp. SPB074]|nr:hypothetical protein SSBG_06170 [Streptomyces sp. SPB074]